MDNNSKITSEGLDNLMKNISNRKPERIVSKTILDAVFACIEKDSLFSLVFSEYSEFLLESVSITKQLEKKEEMEKEEVDRLLKKRAKNDKELDKMDMNPTKAKIAISEAIKDILTRLGFDSIFLDEQFYLFNKEWWMSVNAKEVQKFLRLTAFKIGLEKDVAFNADFIKKLVEQFQEICLTVHSPKQLGKVLLNTLNGTLEFTETGILHRDFCKDDLLFSQLRFNYDPKATAPMFQTFFDRVLPDKEQQRLLFEFLGYTLTNHLKLEKVAILVGTGANGKSVFYDVIREIYTATNMSSYSLRELTDETGNNRRDLDKKLLNFSSEIGANKTDMDNFKKLASGEEIKAKTLYQDSYLMSNYAKLMFNANALPAAVEYNNAYFRRLLIFDFNVTIPEEEQDKLLAQKIIANELPGIFNLIIDGFNRVITQKCFSHSIASEEAIENYKQQSDNVNMFMRDCNYEKHSSSTLPLKHIYLHFKEYCFENGHMAVSNAHFRKRLENIGFKSVRRNDGFHVYTIIVHPSI